MQSCKRVGYTLCAQQKPSTNSGPMEIIVCETSPPSQYANRNVCRHATDRPYD